MAVGKLTILGSVTGSPGGSKTIAPPVINVPNAAYATFEQVLNSGDNTITLPSNPVSPTVVVITPDPGNTVALSLGTGGAQPISPDLPMVLTLPAGTSSFILHAASAVPVAVQIDCM